MRLMRLGRAGNEVAVVELNGRRLDLRSVTDHIETFNPLGPVLVTADEVEDPQSLDLRLWVNGELKQSGSMSEMIFGVHFVIWYLSQFMVLRPGDLINTGTPAGVALGQPGPKPYLRADDVVTLEIDGLDRATQTFAQTWRSNP